MAKLHRSITLRRVMRAVEADDSIGFCKACGCEAFNVEPDAERYVCEACGKRAVYGAEQIFISTPWPDAEVDRG